MMQAKKRCKITHIDYCVLACRGHSSCLLSPLSWEIRKSQNMGTDPPLQAIFCCLLSPDGLMLACCPPRHYIQTCQYSLAYVTHGRFVVMVKEHCTAMLRMSVGTSILLHKCTAACCGEGEAREHRSGATDAYICIHNSFNAVLFV